MDQLTEKLKKYEMDILKEFNRICKKNSIDYCLTYGSLLGCIRHNGFIPWDDDIDVFMTRTEYRKFKDVVALETAGSKFGLLDPEENYDYPYIFSKFVDVTTTLVEKELEHLPYNTHIYMDIFVLDGVPKSRLWRWMKCKMYYIKYVLHRIYFLNLNQENGPRKTVYSFIKKLINIKKLKKSIGKTFAKFEEKSNLVKENLMHERSVFMPRENFEHYHEARFEDMMLPIPNDYSMLLEKWYGDYMQYPPEEKRKSAHNFAQILF